MASKFQNRLVGTIIIVALGVIILPGVFDGKKKHYREEFAAIPLVPKPGDQQETDLVPPVTHALPAQPSEGSRQAVVGSSGKDLSQTDSDATVSLSHNQPTLLTPPIQQKTKSVEKPQLKPETVPEKKSVAETAPIGQGYVVQLGALKNAAKVNEIIAHLRLSGYRAFTAPATPIQGQITRIYVGPDASKAKMQAMTGELQSISGLAGVVKPYSIR